MNHFTRRVLALMFAVPAMLVAGATTALAVPPPDPGGYGLYQSPPVPPGDPYTWGDRLQWMVTGASIVIAIAILYVAATALVHRHQTNTSQLHAS